MDEWTSFSSGSVENATEDGEPPSFYPFRQYPAYTREFLFLPLRLLLLCLKQADLQDRPSF